MPKRPPSFHAGVESATQQGKLNGFIELSQKLSQEQTTYFHWDEFRHRISKRNELNQEEQWAALKFSRQSKYQYLPFTDIQDRPFCFFITQDSFEKLHNIDMSCGGALPIHNEVINPDTRDRYYITSLIEESLTSSQIEGAVVTRSEAKELIRKGRRPINNHEQMVLNNFRTMQQISEWKNEELTPSLILEIQRSVTTGTLDNPNHVGSFRNNNDVNVVDEESNEVFHNPPSHEQIEAQIQALCDFANDKAMKGFLHPAIRAIVVHFWFAYLHPCFDGNGRTARALFYWTMLKNDFWLFEFISISHEIKKAPKKYYRAFLHCETDEGDLNYFIHHQLSVITNAIQALHHYLDRQRNEYQKVASLLNNQSDFNHRQLALFKHALKHQHAIFTVQSHQNSHKIANQTARTDLQQLEKSGFLQASKSGRSTIWSPAPDLKEKLSIWNKSPS